MNKVEIYSHPSCSYCRQAKQLLDARGIPYDEINVANDHALLRQMIERTGGRTFPQVIINDAPIGGYETLHRLDRERKLDTLVKH